MNKVELIDAIANETGLAKKDIDATLKSFMSVVSDTLQKKDKVQLIGFGTFETSERAARTGRNPANGEPLKIAASTQVKFKAGTALKEKVAFVKCSGGFRASAFYKERGVQTCQEAFEKFNPKDNGL